MKFSPEQSDALTECINIGMGRAGAMLNDMLGSRVSLQVPSVEVLDVDQVVSGMGEIGSGEVAAVRMKFGGSFQGSTALVFPSASAVSLVRLLMASAPASDDMDAMKSGALTEIGNIVLNAVMGSLVNLVKAQLDFVVPSYVEDSPANIIKAMAGSHDMTQLILAKTNFQVERNAVAGCVIIVFEIPFMPRLREALDRMIGG